MFEKFIAMMKLLGKFKYKSLGKWQKRENFILALAEFLPICILGFFYMGRKKVQFSAKVAEKN